MMRDQGEWAVSPNNRVPTPCTVPVWARYRDDLLGEVTFTGLCGFDYDIALIRSQAWRQGWKVLEHRQAEETSELIFYAERIVGQRTDTTTGAHGGQGWLIPVLLLATVLGAGLFAWGRDFVWILAGSFSGPLLSKLARRRKGGQS